MGLKGYRLWVMGQLDSTCRAPPRRRGFATAATERRIFTPRGFASGWDDGVFLHRRVVALQVEI
jgi:hypothetical protein